MEAVSNIELAEHAFCTFSICYMAFQLGRLSRGGGKRKRPHTPRKPGRPVVDDVNVVVFKSREEARQAMLEEAAKGKRGNIERAQAAASFFNKG